MPRHSVEDLGSPPRKFRVDRHTDDPSGIITFETVEDCLREDQRRLKALKTFALSAADAPARRRARRLARRLSAIVKGVGQ